MRTLFVFRVVIACFTAAQAAAGAEKLRTHRYENVLWGLAVSRDGTRYAVGGVAHRGVLVFERASGRIVARIPQDLGHIYALTFSPDGATVAFPLMAGDGKKQAYMAVRVARVAAPPEAFDLKAPAADMDHVAFSSDGKLLAAGQIDGTVLLWEVRSRKLLLKSDKQSAPSAVAFAPSAAILAAASRDGSVHFWNVPTRKHLRALKTRTPALAARFNRDGRQLLVGTLGGEVEVWPATGIRPTRIIRLPDVKEPVELLALAPDGTRAATVYNNVIQVSDLPSGKPVVKLMHSEGNTITHLAFSGDGALLLSGASSALHRRSEVILWRLGPATPKK